MMLQVNTEHARTQRAFAQGQPIPHSFWLQLKAANTWEHAKLAVNAPILITLLINKDSHLLLWLKQNVLNVQLEKASCQEARMEVAKTWHRFALLQPIRLLSLQLRTNLIQAPVKLVASVLLSSTLHKVMRLYRRLKPSAKYVLIHPRAS